ncbi:MAG: hypothetical protein R3C59_28355 [Planctomycetaceae bacterium]
MVIRNRFRTASSVFTAGMRRCRRRKSRSLDTASIQAMENLEVRQLMTATMQVASEDVTADSPAEEVIISLRDGVLQIEGTGRADRVEVRSSADGENIVVRAVAGPLFNAGDNESALIEPPVPQVVEFSAGDVQSIRFTGSTGNDYFLNQSDIPSVAEGGAGNDWLFGGSGNDSLVGGAGEDFLFGGPGNDHLTGDLNQDHLIVGTGSDTIIEVTEPRDGQSAVERVDQAIRDAADSAERDQQRLDSNENDAIAAEHSKYDPPLQRAREILDDAIKNAVALFDEAVTSARKFADDRVADALAHAIEVAGKIAGDLDRETRAAEDQAAAAINAASQRMQSLFNEASRQAQEQISRASQQLRDNIDRVERETDRAIDAAYDAYKSTKKTWDKWAAAQKKALTDSMNAAIRRLPRWARSKAGAITRQFTAEIDKQVAKADRIIETARAGYKSARSGLQRSLDKTVSGLRNAFQTTVSTIQRGQSEAEAAARSTFDAIKDSAQATRTRLIQEAATQAAQRTQELFASRDEAISLIEREHLGAVQVLASHRDGAISQAEGKFRETTAPLEQALENAITEVRKNFAQARKELIESQPVVRAQAAIDAVFSTLADSRAADVFGNVINVIASDIVKDSLPSNPLLNHVIDALAEWHTKQLGGDSQETERSTNPDFDIEVVNATYQKFKEELLREHIGPYGFVLNDKSLEDESGMGDANYGDAQFRTGLTAIAFIIEGDYENAASLLRSLIINGFDENGQPRKYPGKHEGFTRDQFLPQFVAAHLGWQSGDETLRILSRELMSRHLQNIRIDGTLDRTLESTINQAPLLPDLIEDVATEMGLEFSAEAFSQDLRPVVTRAAREYLDEFLQDWLQGRLKTVQLPVNNVLRFDAEATPIQEIFDRITELAVGKLDIAADVSQLYVYLDHALAAVNILPEVHDALLDEFRQFLPVNVPDVTIQEVFLVRDQYHFWSERFAQGGEKGPDQAYAGHLLFWQLFLFEDLHPETADFYQPLKQRFADATRVHNWANYDLLAGNTERPEEMLMDWKDDYRVNDYIFQKPRQDQDDKAGKDEERAKIGLFAPVDYLVLWALYKKFGSN